MRLKFSLKAATSSFSTLPLMRCSMPNYHPRWNVRENLCSGQKVCPAFVPPWTVGEQREAAQIFLDFLMSN
jgi:hypothetical protein